MDAELLEKIRAYAAHKVAEGFATEEEIVEWVIDNLYDNKAEDLRPHAHRIMMELLEQHRRAQERWIRPTDCDKLDMAFAELERQGIVARQHFEDCGTCGHSAIWGEIKSAQAERPVKGYVFYHWQDTEQAVYGSFFLAYGSVEDSEEALVTVAKTIITTLNRFGIHTEWNGQTNTRILVKDFDWKRRRTFEAVEQGRKPPQ